MAENREKLMPQEAPKKRRTWLTIVIVLVVLCCVLVVCGGGGYALFKFGDQIIEWVTTLVGGF